MLSEVAFGCYAKIEETEIIGTKKTRQNMRWRQNCVW